jgi:hypothetical protein
MTQEALEKMVNEMKLNLPDKEVPGALEKIIVEKHQGELEDLLLKLYEQKCMELKEEILAMMEEKIAKQQEVRKGTADKKRGIDAIISRTIDQGQIADLKKQKDKLDLEMNQEIEEIEETYRKKEAQITREVQERTADREAMKIEELSNRQIDEKREIFEHFLPESMMTTLNQKLGDQER